MKFIKLIYCLFLTFVTIEACAQNAPEKKVIQNQPKIMVMPFTKENEDMRTVLESDENKRIAITKIKEGFDNRGFTTVDFLAKLKAAKENNLFTSDNQADLKSLIISMSGADVIITADVNYKAMGDGSKYCTINLSAEESATGNSLSNKVCNSPSFFDVDYGMLAEKAISKCMDDFLNTMQAKFDDIIKNGASIYIDISFTPDSKYNSHSEIDGLPLSDNIDQWMKDHALNNQYSPAQVVGAKIIYEDVKIPLKDPTTHYNYTPNDFAKELFKYLKGIGMSPQKENVRGKIHITIK